MIQNNSAASRHLAILWSTEHNMKSNCQVKFKKTSINANQPIWAVFKEQQRAVASILGRSDSHAKPQLHCAIENKDHLLREQHSVAYLPHYRSLDISRQILANQNGCRKDRYQAWKSHRLTQYTLNILRGWCFRTSAAAQDDHSTQNTIFTGQKGWAWTSRANATSEMTKHAVRMIQQCVSPQPRNCHARFSVL